MCDYQRSFERIGVSDVQIFQICVATFATGRWTLNSSMDSLTTRDGSPFRRELLESLLKRRFFFTPAFEAYRTFDSCKGATRGLFDYGPPGCALQANVVDLWRKHFVLEEDMLELDCTILTPAEVFKTSGHVDKFADWMCKDSITGEYTRADHLVQNVLEARLKGDKTARGLNTEALVDGEVDGKKAKKQIKSVKAAKLDDALVAVYEDILAKVSSSLGLFGARCSQLRLSFRSLD